MVHSRNSNNNNKVSMDNHVRFGDFFEQYSKEIAPETVDLIWGDPIYQRPEQYGATAAVADRILKPGGHLILQTCSYYQYAAETEIRTNNKTLTPRTTLIETYPRQYLGTWRDLVTVGMRPYLWYSKKVGTKVARHGHWVPDHYMGGGKQKSMHDWGDSARFAEFYIGKLVGDVPDAVVVDPFAGSGLIAAICLKLNIQCYSYEIDKQICDKANLNLFGDTFISSEYWNTGNYQAGKEQTEAKRFKEQS